MSKIKYANLLEQLDKGKLDIKSKNDELVINDRTVKFPDATDRDNVALIAELFKQLENNKQVGNVKISVRQFKDKDPGKVVSNLLSLLANNTGIYKITINDLDFADGQKDSIKDLLFKSFYIRLKGEAPEIILNDINYTKAYRKAIDKFHEHTTTVIGKEFFAEIAKQEKALGHKKEVKAPKLKVENREGELEAQKDYRKAEKKYDRGDDEHHRYDHHSSSKKAFKYSKESRREEEKSSSKRGKSEVRSRYDDDDRGDRYSSKGRDRDDHRDNERSKDISKSRHYDDQKSKKLEYYSSERHYDKRERHIDDYGYSDRRDSRKYDRDDYHDSGRRHSQKHDDHYNSSHRSRSNTSKIETKLKYSFKNNQIDKKGYLDFADLLHIITLNHKDLKYINLRKVNYHINQEVSRQDLPSISKLFEALEGNNNVQELYMHYLKNINGLQGRENIGKVLESLYQLIKSNENINMVSLKGNDLNDRNEEVLKKLLRKGVALNTQNNDDLNYNNGKHTDANGKHIYGNEKQIHHICAIGIESTGGAQGRSLIGPEGGFNAYYSSKKHDMVMKHGKSTNKASWDFKYQQHAFGNKFVTFNDMVKRIEENNKQVKMFDLDKVNYTLNKDQYWDKKAVPDIKNLFTALKYNTHVKQLYLDGFQDLTGKMHGVSNVHRVMKELEYLLLDSKDHKKANPENNIEMVSLKGVDFEKEDIDIIKHLDQAGINLDLGNNAYIKTQNPKLFRDCKKHFEDYAKDGFYDHCQLAKNWEWQEVEVSGHHGSSHDSDYY